MCFNACRCVASAIVSILLGVLIGIVFFNALLPGIAIAIIIALSIATVTLIILAIIGTFVKGKEKKCVCKVGKCALVGAILTLIIGLIIVSLPFTTGVVGTAILVGIGAATLFFNIFSLAEVLACILECERCDYDYKD